MFCCIFINFVGINLTWFLNFLYFFCILLSKSREITKGCVYVCLKKQKRIEWKKKPLWLPASHSDIIRRPLPIYAIHGGFHASGICLNVNRNTMVLPAAAFYHAMGFRSSGLDGGCWLTCPIATRNQYHTVIYQVNESATRKCINLKYSRWVSHDYLIIFVCDGQLC